MGSQRVGHNSVTNTSVAWLVTNKVVSPTSVSYSKGSWPETLKYTLVRKEQRRYFRIKLICHWALQLNCCTHLSLKFIFPKFLRKAVQSKGERTGKMIFCQKVRIISRT